ncbi:ribose-phosphate diphosphokinase [Pseudoalteromonas piratica]|uniref:Ribose-phosphate pyrophosphokinase n=1 Tax=Pseudoalteromonas piratica TaxID=1348114 RepID=A0A0A7EHP7_9GAMM|nr:ribose-phosphate diphosphokinase [Pseudoalteromonas piratica]AIY66129.1 ribose-phosphate pyrophosphokinase [Pseudoalteromonas piratica]
MNSLTKKVIVFSLNSDLLAASLSEKLGGHLGQYSSRDFPDGESYLRIESNVENSHCIVVADLSHPNKKYLPLIFLLDTLKELGAKSVGLVAPYLSYMRQDRRFIDGEAITSKLFAKSISKHIDYLVTVDPHLHRYHSLDEIYSVPSVVVQGAPVLAQWLKGQSNLFLVGPDSESEQWIISIAKVSGHSFVIGEKNRKGDRDVEVSLPDLSAQAGLAAVIIDDVISSGQTILSCISALKKKGIKDIKCAAVHGIFADGVDQSLLESGLSSLITTNTITHPSNGVDISSVLVEPVIECLSKVKGVSI